VADKWDMAMPFPGTAEILLSNRIWLRLKRRFVVLL
jgi:hypothetical protein